MDVAPRTDAQGRDRQLTGHITTWALGENVATIRTGAANDQYDFESGTSFATPQIAGLAAYFLTLPGLTWLRGQVSQIMKDFIVRNNRHQGKSPDGWGMAYNGVETIIEHCPQPGQPGFAGPVKPRGWLTAPSAITDYIASIFKRQKKGDGVDLVPL